MMKFIDNQKSREIIYSGKMMLNPVENVWQLNGRMKAKNHLLLVMERRA